MLDVIIIGAGPAGVAAAIYAARQKLNFLLISKNLGGMANYIPDIENYPGFHYLSGYDLVRKFQEHLDDFKVSIKSEQEVKSVEKKGDGFLVKTDKGQYETKSLVVCSGRGFKKLGVKGEKEFFEKGVSECATCDAPMFKGKTVAVVGGGRSGLLSTMFLMNMVKKIYLVEKNNELGGTDAWREAVRNAKNVEIMTTTEVLEILGDKFVNKIKISRNGKKEFLPVEGVFVEVGYVPHTEFVKNLVKLNDRKEIIIDKENNTSCKGIFAAGDCTDIVEKQVIVSTGEGAKAMMCVTEFLAEQKKK